MSTPNPSAVETALSPGQLREHYISVRQSTRQLVKPLPAEDQVVQTMADVSPTKWHLAHTTWFFETFVLAAMDHRYEPFNEGFDLLFNSYYQGAGPQWKRSKRGLLGRPTVATIEAYRAHVDAAMQQVLGDDELSCAWAPVVEIGLHHERQHQELILSDIKHVLATNPLRPIYRRSADGRARAADTSPTREWLDVAGGVHHLGFDGAGFCFDNELPRHRVLVDDFQLASQPVTCREFMEFIDDGGYSDPRWWLSEGWNWVEEQSAKHPLYWELRGDKWWQFTLHGMEHIDEAEPVCHVNYFEADAFARWRGARLPTEAEWEIAASDLEVAGNFADDESFHPRPIVDDNSSSTSNHRFFGDVWEWTSSAYSPYPGFRPWEETLGEYNGKFMCNQYVLRGGCCATPRELVRPTYRNFFPPDARWQFTGFRLAK